MDERIVHIVSHDVPFPANYGGVIDIFYKIKWLHANGIKIILHCFTQGRLPQDELDKYCIEVNYYKRKKNIISFSFFIPFIVNSRNNKKLNTRLLQDTYPIIFEGIHTTAPLYLNLIKERKVIIRLQNVEHVYYDYNKKNCNNFLKKIFYWHESLLLKKYEKKIANKAKIFCLSNTDKIYYENELNAKDVYFVPSFLKDTKLASNLPLGYYCLYHGNLEIPENENAVKWLLKYVFDDNEFDFVIAGNNPSETLQILAHKKMNHCIVANPSNTELNDLINKAQINILPSRNKTGVKIKLLNALLLGKHCIVNYDGANGSGLEESCIIANEPHEFKRLISNYFNKTFSDNDKHSRQVKIDELYTPSILVKYVTDYFWS